MSNSRSDNDKDQKPLERTSSITSHAKIKPVYPTSGPTEIKLEGVDPNSLNIKPNTNAQTQDIDAPDQETTNVENKPEEIKADTTAPELTADDKFKLGLPLTATEIAAALQIPDSAIAKDFLSYQLSITDDDDIIAYLQILEDRKNLETKKQEEQLQTEQKRDAETMQMQGDNPLVTPQEVNPQQEEKQKTLADVLNDILQNKDFANMTETQLATHFNEVIQNIDQQLNASLAELKDKELTDENNQIHKITTIPTFPEFKMESAIERLRNDESLAKDLKDQPGRIKTFVEDHHKRLFADMVQSKVDAILNANPKLPKDSTAVRNQITNLVKRDLAKHKNEKVDEYLKNNDIAAVDKFIHNFEIKLANLQQKQAQQQQSVSPNADTPNTTPNVEQKAQQSPDTPTQNQTTPTQNQPTTSQTKPADEQKTEANQNAHENQKQKLVEGNHTKYIQAKFIEEEMSRNMLKQKKIFRGVEKLSTLEWVATPGEQKDEGLTQEGNGIRAGVKSSTRGLKEGRYNVRLQPSGKTADYYLKITKDPKTGIYAVASYPPPTRENFKQNMQDRIQALLKANTKEGYATNITFTHDSNDPKVIKAYFKGGKNSLFQQALNEGKKAGKLARLDAKDLIERALSYGNDVLTPEEAKRLLAEIDAHNKKALPAPEARIAENADTKPTPDESVKSTLTADSEVLTAGANVTPTSENTAPLSSLQAGEETIAPQNTTPTTESNAPLSSLQAGEETIAPQNTTTTPDEAPVPTSTDLSTSTPTANIEKLEKDAMNTLAAALASDDANDKLAHLLSAKRQYSDLKSYYLNKLEQNPEDRNANIKAVEMDNRLNQKNDSESLDEQGINVQIAKIAAQVAEKNKKATEDMDPLEIGAMFGEETLAPENKAEENNAEVKIDDITPETIITSENVHKLSVKLTDSVNEIRQEIDKQIDPAAISLSITTT